VRAARPQPPQRVENERDSAPKSAAAPARVPMRSMRTCNERADAEVYYARRAPVGVAMIARRASATFRRRVLVDKMLPRREKQQSPTHAKIFFARFTRSRRA